MIHKHVHTLLSKNAEVSQINLLEDSSFAEILQMREKTIPLDSRGADFRIAKSRMSTAKKFFARLSERFLTLNAPVFFALSR